MKKKTAVTSNDIQQMVNMGKVSVAKSFNCRSEEDEGLELSQFLN